MMTITMSKTTPEIQLARTCYDHMAGKLGVAITQSLIDAHVLESMGKQISVTPEGERWFSSIEIDVDKERSRNRKFAYGCIDGTERKPHLAGALGAALCRYFLDQNWIERAPGTRALKLTSSGELALERHFGINLSL